MPGNLVAIDMEPGNRDWSLIGEYPEPEAGARIARGVGGSEGKLTGRG
jgi:hypothetical protein